MDKSIPPGAALLLDFIGGIEAPHGYNTVYGNNQSRLPKPLTSMTIDEVIAAGPRWTRSFGSSAAGRYQFMRATLQHLKKTLGLSGKEKLDANMQDRLGLRLLVNRGYEKFMAGSTSRTAFGLALAQEWASFPVLAPTKGQRRKVARGQSFYAGDGLNKALVAPEKVEATLGRVRAAGGKVAAPAPSLPAPAPVPEIRTDRITVKVVQQELLALGYTEVGEIDGRLGDFTRNALLAFQTDNGLPLTGVIDHATLAALDTASPRKVAPARETAPPDLVREKVPEVRSNWLTKVGAFFAGIFALLGSLFDGIVANLGVATDKIEPIKEAFGDVPGWLWFLLLAGVAAGVWLISSHGEKKGVEAFQSGARR